MTWGSNASFATTKCRYCGADDIDDRDEGLSWHELYCDGGRMPSWWHRLLEKVWP